MQKEQLHKAIIIGYRELMEERYQYEYLQKEYQLPPAFDAKRVELFKNYFLDYIYPAPEERKTLEAAFGNLAAYIKNPEKLLRILLDSSSLIFKYGRHLPQILKAGLNALKSFMTATELENKLIENAIALKIEAPFSPKDIQTMLTHLSKKDLMNFIANNEVLFETLYDRKLVKNIIEIVETLIAKMQKRPQVYTPAEILALTIGRDIIRQGNALFDELNKKEQQEILETVLKIEKQSIERIF
jgi:hypothetical protein